MHVIRTSAFVHINASVLSTCKFVHLFQIVHLRICTCMWALQAMSTCMSAFVHINAHVACTCKFVDLYQILFASTDITCHESTRISTCMSAECQPSSKFVDLYQINHSLYHIHVSSVRQLYMHVHIKKGVMDMRLHDQLNVDMYMHVRFVSTSAINMQSILPHVRNANVYIHVSICQ